MLWVEKYRPKSLDEILAQEVIKNYLSSYIGKKNLPNLLLYGPEGTGKTSTVYAISNELYGEFSSQNLTHFDASKFFLHGKRYLESEPKFERFYDRSKSAIEVFKQIVREYSSISPVGADFKLIFFNNAEYLSTDAQHALRRMMEKYNRSTRFIFSTTRRGKIIPAIQSRCLNLRFCPLPPHYIKKILKYISEREGISITDGGIDAIVYLSKGNAGKAINTLQISSEYENVDEEVVYEIVKTRKEFVELLDLALGGDFIRIRNILDRLLIDEGLSGEEILSKIHEMIPNLPISQKRMAEATIWLGEADVKIIEGLNSRIHLEELLLKFSRLKL